MKEELSQAIARALSSGTGMSHSASRRKPLELPTAGSVVEDGPDITTKHGYPAYSVAQHERIVASLQAEIAKRDAAIEEWSGTAVQNGMEVDRLTAALSAQQSAPERGDGWIPVSERLPAVAQEVIVDSEFDGVTAGFLDSYGEWYSPNSDYKLTRVVAWQPLPAAPSLKVPFI